MPKCDFIKVALLHGCSPVNLLHIFRTPFPKNNSKELLLKVKSVKAVCKIGSSNVRNIESWMNYLSGMWCMVSFILLLLSKSS